MDNFSCHTFLDLTLTSLWNLKSLEPIRHFPTWGFLPVLLWRGMWKRFWTGAAEFLATDCPPPTPPRTLQCFQILPEKQVVKFIRLFTLPWNRRSLDFPPSLLKKNEDLSLLIYDLGKRRRAQDKRRDVECYDKVGNT